jgi:hypothetical protein
VPFVHAGLESIIMMMLEKWPAQRQQSAAELKDALQSILPELRKEPFRLGATARESSPASPPGRRPLTEIPAESVRHVKTFAPAETMRSLDPAKAAAGRTGDTLPEQGGVVVHLPNDSGPVHASSPTVPAAHVSSETLPSGERAPVHITVKPPKENSSAAKVERQAERSDTRPSYPAPQPTNLAAPKPAKVKKKSKETSFWVLVPFAVLIGITVGAVVFFLTQ